MKKVTHLKEKLDAYFDGELFFWQRWVVIKHLRRCEHCQQQLQEKLSLSKQLHRLPIQSCPNGVLERISEMASTADAPQRLRRHKLALPRRSVFAWKLAGVLTALVVVLFLVYRSFQPQVISPKQRYTSEEVAQARKEIEVALSYVARAARITEKAIEERALSEYLIGPIKKGLTRGLNSV